MNTTDDGGGYNSNHSEGTSSSSSYYDDSYNGNSSSRSTKATVSALQSQLRRMYIAVCFLVLFVFVSAVCSVIIVVALYNDSQTLNTMAVQGTQIMTTVQEILADFQDTQMLSTVKQVSGQWTDHYSTVATHVSTTLSNTANIADDLLSQFVQGNSTALVKQGLYEFGVLIDRVQHMLDRFSSVFNIPVHIPEFIAASPSPSPA